MSSDRLVAGGITSLVAMIWARLPRQGNLCTICTQIGEQICQVTLMTWRMAHGKDSQ
jgi:hypothetical protein